MARTLTASLAPDTGEVVYSDRFIVPPGESVTYAATWVAGDTQSVSFQYSDSPEIYWFTHHGPVVMDAGADDFSGTFQNKTRGNLVCRFRNAQTDTSTDEEVSVTITSVADSLPGNTVQASDGSNLQTFSDEDTRLYVKEVHGTTTEPIFTTAASQTIRRSIYSLRHTSAYGFYTRSYIDAASVSGDAARTYATVNNVAAGTVRGLHCSLSFGASGTVSGLGVAAEFTLHMKSGAGASGTIAPIKAAINSDAATSDPVGASLSYIQIANQGDATGGADVDTDVNLFEISGHTIGNGNLIMAAASEIALAAFTHGIRLKIGSTLYYIPISTTAPSGW